MTDEPAAGEEGQGRRVKRRLTDVERELTRRAAEVGRRSGRANEVVIRHVPPWSLKPGGKPGRRA